MTIVKKRYVEIEVPDESEDKKISKDKDEDKKISKDKDESEDKKIQEKEGEKIITRKGR